MSRPLLTAAALWGAVACTATYSSSFSASTSATAQASVSSSTQQANAPAVVLTAPVDRNAPQASAVPSVDQQRGPQLVPHNPVAASALARDLTPLQKKKIPSGKPAFEALGGMLSQGQATQLEITLQGGRCYAVLALSPSISTFSVELTQQGGDPWLARSIDGVATLDDEPCNKARDTKPARLKLVALQGAGPIVAQVYER